MDEIYTYTLADLAALKRAIATGARKVKFGSGPDAREVEYQSLNQMRSVLADIMAEVAPSQNRSTVSFVEHTRD